MNTKNELKFQWNWLSLYRDELFGLSMLSILFFHYTEDFVNAFHKDLVGANSVLSFYRTEIGSIGVEIFLFLSGMGLYYAWNKMRGNYLDFYKKRFLRVLMVYLPVGILYWGWLDLIHEKNGWFSFFKNLSFFSFWTEGTKAVWFIALILILYLVFPLVYALFIDPEGRAEPILFGIILVLTVGSTQLLYVESPEIYGHIEIALRRIPIFLLGVYSGEKIKKNSTWDFLTFSLFAIDVILLRVLMREQIFNSFWNRYVVALSALFLMQLLCIVFHKLSFPRFHKCLKWIGGMSLELYLTHVTIRNVFNKCGYPTYMLKHYLLMIFISVVLSIVLHQIILMIQRKKMS